MEIINSINDFLSTYILVALLLGAGIYFTIRLKGVQFTMIGEMFRLLVNSGHKHDDAAALNAPTGKRISSFQAVVVSLAARVGTGNIAGVAIAIVLGGPGAIFWMWVVALLGSANAFVESTLAQLFKIRGDHSYIGGPAYYIMKGIGKRWYANLFAILITITFSLAFSSVQSNTMAIALKSSFGVDSWIFGGICSVLTLAIICGGIQRIAKINEIIVPIMALMYIGLALYVVLTHITMFPHVMELIVENAFGFNQALGGTLGMAVIQGVKRGLFSNEAGEGSTPNAAATAAVSHPVKQGLIQTLGVFTDTLFVCSATAFIILCSGVFDSGLTGIELTQRALENEVGNAAVIFVALAVIMFAFSSILANYFFGEANLRFINPSVKLRNILRVCVGGVVMIGAIVSLDVVWAIADITMALMALCNIIAIIILGRYSFLCLKDYRRQLKEGKDPVYHKSAIPEIADKTECWPD
ncbi:MAG: alanine:cation symporter family protein [Muribaculaceae bacterium]|nr:alanine:cation symporter family protein [Muribaculaceae bacterium]